MRSSTHGTLGHLPSNTRDTHNVRMVLGIEFVCQVDGDTGSCNHTKVWLRLWEEMACLVELRSRSPRSFRCSNRNRGLELPHPQCANLLCSVCTCILLALWPLVACCENSLSKRKCMVAQCLQRNFSRRSTLAVGILLEVREDFRSFLLRTLLLLFPQ